MFGTDRYCSCRIQKGNETSNEPGTENVSFDVVFNDVTLDDIAFDDVEVRNEIDKEAYIEQSISPFFKKTNLGCLCTTNKVVVKLMKFQHQQSMAAAQMKEAYVEALKALIIDVNKERP